MSHYIQEILNKFNDHEFLVNCANRIISDDELISDDLYHYAIAITVIKGYYEEFIGFVCNREVDLNYKFINNMTLLHYATVNSDLRFCDFLLDNGANLMDQNYCGKTAIDLTLTEPIDINMYCHLTTGRLLKAVISGDYDLINFLLNNGANINVQNELGNTAFHIALAAVGTLVNNKVSEILRNYEAIICLLLSYKIDLNIQNNEGLAPLHFLILHNGQLSTIKFLIKLGANIHLLNSVNKYSMIDYAILTENLELVDFFLKSGVNVNNFNTFNTTLHIAILKRNAKIISLLLRKKINFNAVDNDGNTALHLAAMNGDLDIIKILSGYQININARNARGLTAIYLAIRNHHVDCYKYLELRGASTTDKINDIEVIDLLDTVIQYRNKHLLALITFNTTVNDIKTALNKGAQITAVDEEGNSCLHLAVKLNIVHLISSLITLGCDINAVNNYGETVLHLCNHKNILLTLISTPYINTNVIDLYGNTPITRAAIDNNKYKFMVLWRFVSVETCVANVQGWTFAHYVVINNWINEYIDIKFSKHFGLLYRNKLNGITTLDIAKDHNITGILEVHV